MSRETDSFLDLVRDAEDPTRADRERVFARVHKAVVVAAAGAAIGSAAKGAHALASLGVIASGAAKVGAVVLSLLAAVKVADSMAERAVPDAPAAPGPVAIAAVSGALGSPPTAPATTALPATRTAAPAHSNTAPAALAARSRPSISQATSASASRVGLDPPPAVPVEPLPAASSSNLERELAIIAQAQAALRRGDGAKALAVLGAHPARDARLAAERHALRILALCAAGRITEAKRAATEFSTLHPHSVHRAAIFESCASSDSRL